MTRGGSELHFDDHVGSGQRGLVQTQSMEMLLAESRSLRRKLFEKDQLLEQTLNSRQ